MRGNMNRRGFLGMLLGAAAAEMIPLGRVWSFPSQIVLPTRVQTAAFGMYTTTCIMEAIYYNREALRILKSNLVASRYDWS
jgi:hypothetical protein